MVTADPVLEEENRLDAVSKLSAFLGLFKGPHVALHLFIYLNGCFFSWIFFGFCILLWITGNQCACASSTVLKEDWPPVLPVSLERFPAWAFTSLLPWQYTLSCAIYGCLLRGTMECWREQKEGVPMVRMGDWLPEKPVPFLCFQHPDRGTGQGLLMGSLCALCHIQAAPPHSDPPASVLTWCWKLLWVGILGWVVGTDCCEDLALHMDAFHRSRNPGCEGLQKECNLWKLKNLKKLKICVGKGRGVKLGEIQAVSALPCWGVPQNLTSQTSNRSLLGVTAALLWVLAFLCSKAEALGSEHRGWGRCCACGIGNRDVPPNCFILMQTQPGSSWRYSAAPLGMFSQWTSWFMGPTD